MPVEPSVWRGAGGGEEGTGGRGPAGVNRGHLVDWGKKRRQCRRFCQTKRSLNPLRLPPS